MTLHEITAARRPGPPAFTITAADVRWLRQRAGIHTLRLPKA